MIKPRASTQPILPLLPRSFSMSNTSANGFPPSLAKEGPRDNQEDTPDDASKSWGKAERDFVKPTGLCEPHGTLRKCQRNNRRASNGVAKMQRTLTSGAQTAELHQYPRVALRELAGLTARQLRTSFLKRTLLDVQERKLRKPCHRPTVLGKKQRKRERERERGERGRNSSPCWRPHPII